MYFSGKNAYIFLVMFTTVSALVILSRNVKYPMSYRFNMQGRNDLVLSSAYSDEGKMNPLSVDPIHIEDHNQGRSENRSGFGYVFALDFSDQTTGGAVNLMCLQCWAATVSHKIIVVEPFLHEGSKWGASLTPDISKEEDDKENSVRLRDVLDIKNWDAEAKSRRYNLLTTWKGFLKDSPQDLILVFKPAGRKEKEKLFHDAAHEFAEKYGFRIVRKVIEEDFHTYTAKAYRDLVYGNFSPSSSIVVMSHWGSFEARSPPYRYRSGITGINQCYRNNFFIQSLFHNSDLIKQDAQKYREKYLLNYKKKGYISVMFRSQYFAIRHNLNGVTPDKQMSLLMSCVNSITENVNKLKEKHGVESVILTLDCRKQGSNIYRGSKTVSSNSIAKASEVLYQNLYGNSSTLEEWDDSFDSIGSYRNAGYLAQLQRYLASSGTCLLTAGGGAFQGSAKTMYSKLHTSGVSCVSSVPKC